MTQPKSQPSDLQREVNDLVRGTCGGFLFGIPLFYTMEVWWIGSATSPPLLLLAIATMLLVVFLLNLTQGFRSTRRKTLGAALNDTIDAIAIGLVNAAWMLVLLQEITLQTNLSETLGKVVFESVPFALGAALANQFLERESQPQKSQRKKPGRPAADSRPTRPSTYVLNDTLSDIGATLMGALIIAFSIAPTEEVPMLAAPLQGIWLLLIVLSSLIISYGIVFQANFGRQSQRQQQTGLFQSPISETIVSYLVSLFAAATMLFFFQQVGLETPWETILRYTLVLGLPATIGGAAGRLAL
ncbi:TIGR02587 family membrane protein [Lyngbya confervoides]|uniref:TIGR02587 family membrane protein n=1 Tax=Lyngbya confervoides BDU141951 TaxID=1574623 RepID=A0ABD4T7A5_9CYAN|nr:TIGR02587 family membrane protein [Lyngbya confervoides]MCM1984632.1 TIGR02587 family membrane protein [Lyngbya confervoides BDU141951]